MLQNFTALQHTLKPYNFKGFYQTAILYNFTTLYKTLLTIQLFKILRNSLCACKLLVTFHKLLFVSVDVSSEQQLAFFTLKLRAHFHRHLTHDGKSVITINPDKAQDSAPGLLSFEKETSLNSYAKRPNNNNGWIFTVYCIYFYVIIFSY